MNSRVILQNFKTEQEKLCGEQCFVQVALCSGGTQCLLVFEVCSWHLSQHADYLKKKNIPMMLKIPHSLAWLQAVRMLYSDFYAACWYLDIFTSIMFTIILFFFIKVDCRWICLEEACLKTGSALDPTASQLFWISYSVPSVELTGFGLLYPWREQTSHFS